ncbi:MAG: ferritin-like domain-containing protein [Solirubrobacterales bacterium]|nr:ferritin-like domain-containing protein [Solirubrobacterales bacterium]
MTDLIKLEVVDADGAVREAAEAAGLDRRDVLRRGVVGGGSFLAAGVLFSGIASPAMAAISTKSKSKKNDVRILNYALTLEYLEAEFYAQAVRNKPFESKQYEEFAAVVAEHEAAHVAFIKKALGSAAVKKPSFDFGDTVTNPDKFAATAQVLEDTGVAAYAGQGPNILQRKVVQAALSVHSVEARHAAWIRLLNLGASAGKPRKDQPAPRSFDTALSEKAVLAAVKQTGFIQ